jgi:hypothetical protein
MKLILAIMTLALCASCTNLSVTYLRKDGSYAVKGDSFKERW